MKRQAVLFPILLIGLVVLIALRLQAQVTTARIFGSNMVLQRDRPIKIWGRAKAHETVKLSFNKQHVSTMASANGDWQVSLKPMPAGGPYILRIEATGSQLVYRNILMGDIWVCSGQSNMEFPVSGWAKVDNYEKEIKAATHPSLRLFTVEKDFNTKVLSDLKGGQWDICDPQTISAFSAVGYFFGRDIQNKLKVPIGLINTTWGGTDIESWISRTALDTSAAFKEAVADLPVLDLDSLKNLQEQMALNRVKAIQGGLPPSILANQWYKTNYSDKYWPTMALPVAVEQTALGSSFDGVIWFRKSIDINKQIPIDSAILSLAMIDDSDDTYVNGIRVGGFNGYNQRRIYKLKPGVLKKGKNQIAIRVYDGGGGGGIIGEKKDMYLSLGSSRISLAGDWRFHVASLKQGGGSFGPNSYPSLLFNAMIAPITNLAIKGVIWYQGENNASRAYQYRAAMPLLISDWRARFKQEDFPFYYVQLSSYNAAGGNSNQGSSWAELREAQQLTLNKVTNSGMAISTDIGNAKDIHPTNKQDVGSRLAAIALKNAYGLPVIASGPVYNNLELQSGGHVLLSFSGVGGGLKVKGNVLRGFEVAGEDRQFYPAKAVVIGDKVDLYSVRVGTPIAVRYNWADDASKGNLYNSADLPAAPFRTDDWPLSTENVHYHISL